MLILDATYSIFWLGISIVTGILVMTHRVNTRVVGTLGFAMMSLAAASFALDFFSGVGMAHCPYARLKLFLLGVILVIWWMHSRPLARNRKDRRRVFAPLLVENIPKHDRRGQKQERREQPYYGYRPEGDPNAHVKNPPRKR